MCASCWTEAYCVEDSLIQHLNNMAAFVDLPSEIVEAIGGFMSTRTACVFMAVNKKLNEIMKCDNVWAAILEREGDPADPDERDLYALLKSCGRGRFAIEYVVQSLLVYSLTFPVASIRTIAQSSLRVDLRP